MVQAPAPSPIEIAAANLRGIWAAMLSQFGLFGVEPARQIGTAKWCSAVFRRIDGLIARYQAGRLRRYLARRVVQPGRTVINTSGLRMPRNWAWLVLSGKHHAVAYGVQVQNVLARPEMVELLAVCPQARRVLRPLCRALAIELPWTVDTPRAESAPRIRKPRPKAEPFKHPLPRGALSWARRDKALEKAIKARDGLVLEMAKARGR